MCESCNWEKWADKAEELISLAEIEIYDIDLQEHIAERLIRIVRDLEYEHHVSHHQKSRIESVEEEIYNLSEELI